MHLTGGGSVTVGLNGRVDADGAGHAIRGGGDAATGVAVVLATDGMIVHREDATEAANARVAGSFADVGEIRFRMDRDGVPSGYSMTLPVGEDGVVDASELPQRPCTTGQVRGDDGQCRTPPPDPDPDPGPGPEPAFSCAEAMDGRCRLYEALPSMLLAMNGLPSYAERMAAARDAHGGWASVGAARGEWRAEKATMAGSLAYDHRRSVARAGVDFITDENGRLGMSAHGLRGKAEMTSVGEVELNGMGVGVSAAWLAGSLYLDAQAQATFYDAGVKSYTHGKLLKKDASGAGYALGVDLGKRIPVGGTFVTPRAGLAWSTVELSDFTDMELDGGQARVSMEDAGGAKGRLGLTMETELGSGDAPGRLFGSLDVERAFSDETEVKVGGETLKTAIRPTMARLDVGGAFNLDENVLLKVAAGYRTSGSGTSGYGGSLGLQVRF